MDSSTGDGLVAPRGMAWRPRPRKRQGIRQRTTRFHISPYASGILLFMHQTTMHLSYAPHAFAAHRSAARSAVFAIAKKRCRGADLRKGSRGMVLGYCL